MNEQRVIHADIELRAHDTNGDGMSFRGYAAVFNSDSEPLPFIEQVAPGAFARSLDSRNNVAMLLNHDSSLVLATTRSGSARITEDERGLLVDADLPPTTYGRDLSVMMQRGDVASMSFGFTVPTGGDEWRDDGNRRVLNEVRLHEVSVVTFPAYPETVATVRSTDLLATRADVDAGKLAAAMSALTSDGLSTEQADLLESVIGRLRPNEPAADVVPLAILAKKLDLALVEI
jgi:uncharacterized protein